MEQLFKKGSLFRKYFTVIISIVLIYIIIIGTLLMTGISIQWWDEKTNILIENSKYIASIVDNMTESGGKLNGNLLSNIMTIMEKSTESDFFITDISGKVVVCSEEFNDYHVKNCEKHSGISISEKYMTRALNNGFSDYSRDDDFGFGKFVVAVPITFDGEVKGAIFAVEDAISGLIPYIFGMVRIFFYAFIVVFISSFFIVYITVKRITLPINEMKDVTKHIAKGEFDYRANEKYKEQYLSEFAIALNKMAQSLAVEDEAQKSFIANVSHELKTPMTTIGGFIDGILDGTIPKEKQDEYLSIVSTEVKRLSRLVISMLNLSKIEAGEVSINLKPYDVSSQIFETLLSFERRINDKNIQIEGFEDMHNVIINADRDLLQQVIYNLFDNAVKFTPEGGKITVSAYSYEKKTYVTIRNTCKSVSDEELARLFERFYKVDKSRSFDVKGVGLGLYIVKTIVNMHDGEINANRVNDECLEFVISIPEKTEE